MKTLFAVVDMNNTVRGTGPTQQAAWAVEYYRDTDDGYGSVGGMVVCDTREQAEAEKARLVAVGWTTADVHETEYRT